MALLRGAPSVDCAGPPVRATCFTHEEVAMGADDKIDNKAEELGGKAKEGFGRATGDEELEAEGQGDQAKSNVKQAGEKIKDVFKN
jgi:uncharacterized protein YjbJ (UPF0337 family)